MVSAYPFVYFSQDIVRFAKGQTPQIWMGETAFVKDISHHDEM